MNRSKEYPTIDGEKVYFPTFWMDGFLGWAVMSIFDIPADKLREIVENIKRHRTDIAQTEEKEAE